MSKLKKYLIAGISYVLVATLAIGGTVAYLQDTDEDVNVMTLGNVQIEQIEQEWNADQTQLVDFTQGKPLYPYVGELGWENSTADGGAYRRFTMENVVDKYVSVKNTGKTDAYVRTIIALEMGDYTYDEFNVVGISINKFDGAEFKFDGAWDWTDDFVAQIDGKNYNIMVAVHKDPVKPGETTIPSLLQVYLSKNATNEVAEKLDGNKNGTYDILVLSQAVQAAGFESAKTALDTAFGASATEAAAWFGGVTIPNYVFDQAGFNAAMANAGNINLCCDVDFGGDVELPTALDLGGNTLNSKGIEVANDFAMSNGYYVMKNTSHYLDVRPIESDNYTFTNVTFVNEVKRKPGNTGTDRVEQILKLYPMAAGVKSTFVFENCTFENASVYFGASSDKPADIDVIFKNCTFNAMVASDALIEFGSTITGTVKIEECTFNVEGTYSNNALIDIKTWSSITLDVTATNNILNANKAIAYTYDPAKGETEFDSVKLGTSNVRNYYLFDCLTGSYSTIVETGTILKGDIAAPSK